jgi:hypothetical protein
MRNIVDNLVYLGYSEVDRFVYLGEYDGNETPFAPV